jgi:hypothetical protein
MEPTISKTGTAGAGQQATEQQSLSPQNTTNTANQARNRSTTQDATSTTGQGNQANQQTGYGKSNNT